MMADKAFEVGLEKNQHDNHLFCSGVSPKKEDSAET